MADMSRRRSVGPPPESRKRKYEERNEEGDSDDGSTTDFPCQYCSAVFVTEISLNRHMLTFHDGADSGIVVVDEDVKPALYVEDETEEGDTYQAYDEGENGTGGYYDNETEEDYYYEEQHDASINEFLETGDDTAQSNGTSFLYNSLNGNGGQAGSNSGQKGIKPKLSSNDIAVVLAQVEEMTESTNSEFVTCPLCHKTFGRKELSIHISCEHGGAKFTCPYCGRHISRRDHLKRHIKNVHPDKCTDTEIGPFPRNLNLSRATNSQKKLTSPVMNIHIHEQKEHQHIQPPSNKLLPISIMTPRITVEEDDDEEEDDFEGEEDLTPGNGLQMVSDDGHESQHQDQDSMQITVEPELPFHDLNDMDYNDNEDDYNTPSFLMDSFQQYQEQKYSHHGMNGQRIAGAYQCTVCSATFASKTLLDRHEATHGELRPHKCAVCGKGFLRKEHLSKHLSSVHSGMKFTCEFCGKDISRKDHLIRHIRNVHPTQFYSLPQDSEQDYIAMTQSFQHQQSLPVSFKTAQSLQPKPKKPFFSCDMCEATFVNVDDLHAHQATIHSDVRKYKCNYCCKAFKRKEHLTKHEVLHTGERKFTCRVCGNEFQRKESLQDHIRRVHGGADNVSGGSRSPPPTIPCNLCDQLFHDRSMLLSHMTSIHGLIVNSPPGLPKNSSGQRSAHQNHSSLLNVAKAKVATQPVTSINANSLGSLMDLINKGSITLSFQPVVKSEGN